LAKYSAPDFWTQKAFKEGYPARSVYKLQEIDEKFSLIPKNPASDFRILDVGAAPGSWSLYVLRKLSGRGLLTAIDLSPLSRQYDKGLFDGENFTFLQGDIYSPEIRDSILATGPFNLIISDIAPATSGTKYLDSIRSLELVQAVLAIGQEALLPQGKLLVKIFQGGDSAELLQAMRQTFLRARSYKPTACRSESFETYFLGLGKRG